MVVVVGVGLGPTALGGGGTKVYPGSIVLPLKSLPTSVQLAAFVTAIVATEVSPAERPDEGFIVKLMAGGAPAYGVMVITSCAVVPPLLPLQKRV
jgi:hypothetical protein